jgi:hypothetical protein
MRVKNSGPGGSEHLFFLPPWAVDEIHPWEGKLARVGAQKTTSAGNCMFSGPLHFHSSAGVEGLFTFIYESS